ncbi:multiple sugar transport system substrate-binding protein [Fontibacillus phaseoli]|uniref:Multiple sugar transport system substrate-binding protein n=1 Tax=Fontibacillus phaseoli TaxID=1416533 RepID=A0A369BEH8_9BACL|nr:extracellular solute-binding protein [Fontibacillus phaseoli]RCX18986.1 multiple sugar transport system substrate-binding protein [Fontibacillus phaseoli]
MLKSKKLHKLTLAAMASLLVLITGCNSSPAKETETQRSLKVMFYDESYFFQQYGDLFAMKYPNVDIEVVSTQSIYSGNNGQVVDYNKALRDFIDKEQPDIVMLDTDNYDKMASEGKLVELDSLIERDKYNIDTIYPALIELLKEKGAGKLYGLSPTFNGSAVFYNADLFKKHGIEPPHDGMTWQDILDLSRRFPSDGDEKTRVYGYGTDYGVSFSMLAQEIASAEGLTAVNPDTQKVTVNTDSWKKVYKLALDAMESKTVNSQQDGRFTGGTMEEYYQSQLFLMGRVAITTGHPYLLQNLKDVKNSLKDYKPFELGMVTGPVDPADPQTTRNVYFNEVFGIRAGSPNADAAWDFIKFINGDDYAKIKSRTMNNGLLSRMGYSTEYDGHNLEVFYKLKPKTTPDMSSRMDKIPMEFYSQYQTIMDRELALVLDKKKSIDEALLTIEQEGQAALDKAIKDKEANKGKEDTASGEGAAGTGSSSDSSVIVIESSK